MRYRYFLLNIYHVRKDSLEIKESLKLTAENYKTF